MVGGRIGRMKNWLDRPMTSFHLIVAVFLLLLGIGLVMVLSSSSVSSFRGSSGSSFAVFERQLIFAGIGFVGYYFAARLPIRVIRGWSTAFVMISLGLLVAVLVPGVGKTLNGARSWIGVGAFTFQPAELAKLALLIWSAHVFAARRSSLGSLRQLLIPVLPVAMLMAGLIYLQPDVGTLVTLAIVLAAVMWFAGAPIWLFLGSTVAGVGGIVYLTIQAPYRMKRVLALIDPQLYPEQSYQLLQGLYGMGRGGWFGVGLGQSRAKWQWLPYADSDFIYAIIGEELGLIGATVVILLFGLLAYTGLRIARRNVDPFVKIAAGAVTVSLVMQATVNIGYVVGALPTTGLTLPLISSGGTSLIVTMTAFGLLANFARREPAAATALHATGPGRVSRFLGIGMGR
jgi:cell division protein FtsW